jgi:hypothetical protein
VRRRVPKLIGAANARAIGAIASLKTVAEMADRFILQISAGLRLTTGRAQHARVAQAV